MSRFFNKKIIVSILSLAAILFVLPNITNAGWLDYVTSPLEIVTTLLTSFIEVLILPLAAGIMYLAGIMLDSAMYFSLHTAYIFSLSPAINLGWIIVRDIANIFFIFILIYISFGTIIQGVGGFNTKKLLVNVIIAALLINFSLFITKAVIDVSNIFGGWLYGGIEKTLSVNSTGCDPTGNVICDASKRTSISGLIATRLGILGMWDAAKNGGEGGLANKANPFTDPSQSMIGRFLRLAVVLITTYIFLYISIIFITRSVTLLFLLVFSPIGFMGKVLPQIDEYAKEWRNELSSAAIFPIAFLLMLYIALQFINSIGSLGDAIAGSGAKTVSVFGGNFNVADYFQYFLIIFILHSCLKVAKKYSGELGKKFNGMAEGLGKFGLMAAGGGTALLGKLAIGGAAANLAQSRGLNSVIAQGGVLGKIAGVAQGGLKSTADYHFDPRTGLNLGIKGDKGYSSMMKENEKIQKEAFEKLAPKGKDLKAAKAELEAAEMAAYGTHGKYGASYAALKNTISSSSDLGEINKAKNDLEKVKKEIEADENHNVTKKLFDAQKEALKNTDDKAKKAAIEAAMLQEKVARGAENGLGMKIAQAVSDPKGFYNKQKEAIADAEGNLNKVTEAAATAFAAIAGVATAVTMPGLSKISGDKYSSDNKKIAGVLREAAGGKEKKRKEADLSKLIAGLEDSGGGAAPAAPKPPAGGGDSGGGAKPAGGDNH